jgi:rhodanese-related sulfurtransferase
VNLFVDEAAERASEVLPDKAAAIVTYCSNESCPNSEGVARTLTRLGYTDVRRFREGIQDWVEAGLPTETGARAIAS